VPPEPLDRAALFQAHRTLLFSIAYRMLGSAAATEDVLQEAYLRWEGTDLEAVRSPRDYLVTTVSRLAIDHLRLASVQREVYVGPWLPEPLVGVTADDPLAAMTLAESLSTAFLVMLERLTPDQRAAFLLREVFGYDHLDIARILDTTETNARQLVARARGHLQRGRPRFAATSRDAERLAERFLVACTSGDLDDLLGLLETGAVAWADGGGKFSAARRPVTGRERVARFVVAVVAKWRRAGEVEITPINGTTGLLFRLRGRIRAALTLASTPDGERVDTVFIVVNPDKLSRDIPARA